MNVYLIHSAKGHTWDKHKYVAIINGRYIYPEDLKKNPVTEGINKLFFNKNIPVKEATSIEVPEFNKYTPKFNKSKILMDDAVKAVNKKYNGTTNCVTCTFAIEYMMRTNRLVSAKQVQGRTLDETADFYIDKRTNKKVSFIHTSNAVADDGSLIKDDNYWKTYNKKEHEKQVINSLLKYGNGARGHLSISWIEDYRKEMPKEPSGIEKIFSVIHKEKPSDYIAYYGGHQVMWQVENDKVYIYDGQIGEKIEISKYLNRSGDEIGYNNYPVYGYVNSYLRTDTLDINYKNKYIAKDVKIEPETAKENPIVRKRMVRKNIEKTIMMTPFQATFYKLMKKGKDFISKLFGGK